MDNNAFKQLLNRYKSGAISQEEWEVLRADIADLRRREVLLEDMEETFSSIHIHEFWTVQKEQEVFQSLSLQIAPTRKVSVMPRWWAAAAVLLLLAAATWLLFPRKVNNEQAGVNQITPGKQGAILTLANGSQVLLDTIRNGTVALQGGAIAKVVNGSLKYEGGGDITVYNSINTPNGREYRLTLPDGSRVWLNAASSIRYPTAFVGKNRQVHITGEVYFEVMKDIRRPFFVNIDGRSSVQVLGTSFDINSYGDNDDIRTTLVDGSVSVNDKVVLKPGQQAIQQLKNAQAGEPLQINRHPDIEQILAWKNGVFGLEGADIKQIMPQIERWYDIEVRYTGNIPPIKLKGAIDHGVQLSGIIRFLSDYGLKTELHGRILTVSAK